MAEKFSLKDHLFNEVRVRYLAGLLARASNTIDEEAFVSEVMSRLLTLELKDRIRWIAEVLTRHLPTDFRAATTIIVAALPPRLDPTKTDDDFGEFILAPFGEFVATCGCTKEHVATSLATIEELTMRFSMEDTIRYFLRAFPDETLAACRRWVVHPNYHVRRLVSEGTRPLLPWSGRVSLSTADTLPLLTTLHADSTRYVTRSVANHLNDIAKKDPDTVVALLKTWQQLGTQDSTELRWMITHALRTLIKAGNKDALALIGYSVTKPKQVTLSVSPTMVAAGSTCVFELEIIGATKAALLIDYRIHFQKKNGSTVPKVFKWKTLSIEAGEVVRLEKRHTLKADATTFTLYPGEHKVDVQINGEICGISSFTLVFD